MNTALSWIGGIVVLVLAYKFILTPLIALVFPGPTGRAFFKQQLAANGVAVDRLPPVYISRMAESARDMARYSSSRPFWEEYAVTLQDMAVWTALILRGESHGGTLDWVERELREAGVALGSQSQADAETAGVAHPLPKAVSAPDLDRMVSAFGRFGEDVARSKLATFPPGAQEKIEAALRSLSLEPPAKSNSVGFSIQSLRMVAELVRSRLGWATPGPSESSIVAICYFGIAASVSFSSRGWLSAENAATVEKLFPINVFGKMDGDALADCYGRAEHIASTGGLSRGRAGGIMAMFDGWLLAPSDETFGGLVTSIEQFQATLGGR